MKNYQVIWNGPVYTPSGIGKASREYALALHRQGVDVKVIADRGRARPDGGTSTRTLRILAKKPYTRKKPKVLIYHRLPHSLDIKKARAQFDYLLLNAVWETTKIPSDWFPNINRFDAVCVPSAQNKTAMINSGVKVPVYIVPHGVHAGTFTPSNKKLFPGLPKGTFVFVSVFTFQHRKNPELLLRAYWEAFSSKDRVALVIKTSGFGTRETGAWISSRIQAYKKKLGFGSKTAPIHLITGYTSPGKLKEIYRTGHAFVLPTRGEGVGLPFLEALSSGIPVIATGWGGHMDFLNSRNAFLVRYKLQPPAVSMKRAISRRFSHLFAQAGQLWAEPDLSSLKRQMRYAYEHPDICRSKGQQGRMDMQKMSWNRAGMTMRQVVEHIIRGKK
ncbi:glycosyltransferase family 4 protein [Paenibacillus abyssi]|uniref:Glycosyl transferase family 1 n=1 Tax=Paenibacillus abyssi TaxID=1340531 RepID=A0A917G0T9_9BACL|nr:glycosyltransferase family 4 protein [Paenibacillus abyssi]GGG17039.1 hypothetical protein GCM10010916_37360 [Paenibacillus abyssi]